MQIAGDHVEDPEAFCAQRHHDATGEWPGKKAHTAADDVEAFDWDAEKHPRDEKGRFDSGTGGTGSGQENSIPGIGSVDRYLDAHPRQPGEAIFAWQSRITQGLDPAARHELLFQAREKYPPVGYIQQAAHDYRAAHGLPDPKVNPLDVPAPLAKAEVVARHFEDATDQSRDPKVQAAYQDFIAQNHEMYALMTRPAEQGGMGIKVDYSPKEAGDPYQSAAEQAQDLRDNHHITIQSGLGGDNPLISTAQYDQFRAVHDTFGHTQIGSGFDRHGEYEAWLAHMSMYREPGARVMASEYHGVNCVTPDTLVLTADLRWVRAGDLHLDDELIGFEEQLAGRGRGGSSHLCPALVEHCGRKSLPCFRVVTDRGELTVSSGHAFVAIHRADHTRVWREAKDVNVGDRLVWTTAPWEPLDTHAAGYVAGLLDGDGWVGETRVCFGQNPGLVLDEAIAGLKQHGFEVIVDHPTGRRRKTTVPGNDLFYEQKNVRVSVQGGRWEALRALGQFRPPRLLANSRRIWEGGDLAKRGPAAKNGNSWAQVLAVEFVGDQEVVTLQTSARTFIAEGFPSHNTALWAGKPGTPGTGRAVLLPDNLTRDPWDGEGNLVRAAATSTTFAASSDGIVDAKTKTAVTYLVEKLGLPDTFAADFDRLPWHYARQPAPARTLSQMLVHGREAFEFDPEKHPRDERGRWTGEGGDSAEAAPPHRVRDALMEGLRAVNATVVPESRAPGTEHHHVPRPPEPGRHHRLRDAILKGLRDYNGVVVPESRTAAAAFAYDPNQPRDDHGRWDSAGDGDGPDTKTESRGKGTKDDPVYTSDPTEAARLLGEGKYVQLDQPRTVSTMLDKIKQYADEAKAKGGKVPNYDLCRATVAGTNLFCVQSEHIPRVMMPQLKGVPEKGSWADKNLPRDVRGEVDLGPSFVEYLKGRGIDVSDQQVPANVLRASQNELNGAKVAGMVDALDSGVKMDGSIFATKDDYVVDGHHRWAAEVARGIDQGSTLKLHAQVIDAPILKVLAIANNFTTERGLPHASVSQNLKAALAKLLVFAPH